MGSFLNEGEESIKRCCEINAAFFNFKLQLVLPNLGGSTVLYLPFKNTKTFKGEQPCDREIKYITVLEETSMKINNLATPFLANYEATLDYYETYFEQHPYVFQFYFQFHCKNKEEKLERALKHHPQILEQMSWVTEHIPDYTTEITKIFEEMFSITFTEDIQIFVGLDGSMAYTTHSMNPQVAFSVNRIEAEEIGLKVLIAHEFGHATHHLYSSEHGIGVRQIKWGNPYTCLMQEGLATYLSMQVVAAPADVYFAFGRDEDWLAFVQTNKKDIFEAFQKDLKEQNPQVVFNEWFSINGGKHFGYKAIAYYIGYEIVEKLVEQQGIEQTILLWGQEGFEQIIDGVLNELKNMLE